MNKEEWIDNQIEQYRIRINKEFDKYTHKEQLVRKWIDEYKDIEPEVCEVLEFFLTNMMNTGDGDKRKKYWQSILVFCRDIDGFPIRR